MIDPTESARDSLQRAFVECDERFWAGDDVLALVRERAHRVDVLLQTLWHQAHFESGALIATGGFGRGELFPQSDVDVLIVLPVEADAALRERIATWGNALWQSGIRPALAVRSLDECESAAREDLSVFTSLLDARCLCGDARLLQALHTRAGRKSALWPPKAFVEAKREEQRLRHHKLRDTAHNLEPNLKEGRGGLRDVHLLHWLETRLAASPKIQIAHLPADAAELQQLHVASRSLCQFRYALHLLAQRPEERLLFDHQREIAKRLVNESGLRENERVERCMQDYFRAADTLDRLCARGMQRLSELADEHVLETKPLAPGFVRAGDWLDLDAQYRDLPLLDAVFNPFAWLLSNPALKGLRFSLQRALDARLANANADELHSDAAAQALMALLRDPGDVPFALRELARHGVLSRVLPPFAAIVGRMQYDMFHVYTVDQHNLRVVDHLHRFSREGASPALAHEVHARLRKPELLLIAGLFHDIAKGRGGDHSELGEVDVRAFATRAGLPQGDVELLAWLVRYHLDMSTTAQRKDITDPTVVHRFATFVAEQERLDYLYLLTVADISGTSPTLWNSWKERLLADLYRDTHYMLAWGLEQPVNSAVRIAETRDAAILLLLQQGLPLETIHTELANFPRESFLRYLPEQLAWQVKGIVQASQLPVILVRARGARGSTEVFVHADDRAGLFATLTATLDRLQLNVLEARIVTAANARTLDTFQVMARDGSAIETPEQIEAIIHSLRQELTRPQLQPRIAKRLWTRQQKHFRIPPQIVFTPLHEPERTQMALVCSDRPGLLALLAHAFWQDRISVIEARIATFGERVEDFFELQDNAGKPLTESTQERLRVSIESALDATMASNH